MRILLIKPKQIGDTLILTPTIVALKQAHPEAEIWVLVRRDGQAILSGCPEIHRILTLSAVNKRQRRWSDFWRDLGTLRQLRSVRFDYVFELGDGHRGRLFALACRTKKRYSVKPTKPLKNFQQRRFTAISTFDWESCHRIEKDFFSVAEFLPLPQPIPPLRFDRKRTQNWEGARELSNYGVVQIGTREGFNRWHREGWLEVCRYLLGRLENIVITCGPAPHEMEEAAWLQQELGPRVLCTMGQASWAEVAGLLYQAKLYVGLNTAAMHLAAACGCPIVALFGSTLEAHWRPWQAIHRIVTSTDITFTGDAREDIIRIKQRSMAAIPAQKVIAACEEMLRV